MFLSFVIKISCLILAKALLMSRHTTAVTLVWSIARKIASVEDINGILSVPGALLLASDFTTLSTSQYATSPNVNCSERWYCIRTNDACGGVYPHSSASDLIF